MSHKKAQKRIFEQRRNLMKRYRYLLFVLIVLAISAVTTQAQTPVAVETITAEELKAKLASNQPVMIIDVRSPQGYAASTTTIQGAIHFKVRKLKSRLKYAPLKDLPKDREIVTYCACPNDESSISAAQVLQASGFKRVRVLQGGWTEWLRAKGPVEPRVKT
jgi:rhodanese-related sulfurtransferase